LRPGPALGGETPMPLPPEVVPLVREFRGNGMKFLFQNGENVADFVSWCEPDIARHIDFAKLEGRPETFVAPDFARLESDVLLRGPFGRGRRSALVYVLIENQSEPDELMVFRVLRYVVAVYERQAAEWLGGHSNLRGFRFDPVLPIVLYTGGRTWEALTP